MRNIIKSAALVAVMVLAAGCAEEPQKQTFGNQPVVANAAAPAIATPDQPSVPVPAYGPSAHPHYYYPPTGFAIPGGR